MVVTIDRIGTYCVRAMIHKLSSATCNDLQNRCGAHPGVHLDMYRHRDAERCDCNLMWDDRRLAQVCLPPLQKLAKDGCVSAHPIIVACIWCSVDGRDQSGGESGRGWQGGVDFRLPQPLAGRSWVTSVDQQVGRWDAHHSDQTHPDRIAIWEQGASFWKGVL